MEGEQVLELMDSCWFQRRIFRYKHESPSLAALIKYGGKNLQIRSYRDRCIAVDPEADSPTSVIIKPKEKQRIKKRCSRRGLSRSLSALEFQELKGFMDLGFVFDEKETNPGLASIIPGLKLRGKVVAVVVGGVEVSRPYLSGAWSDLNWRRKEYGKNILRDWKSHVKNEMDMKVHLMIWAHVVASTVR